MLDIAIVLVISVARTTNIENLLINQPVPSLEPAIFDLM